MAFVPALIAGAATIASSFIANKSTGQKSKNKQLSTQTKGQKEISDLIAEAVKSGKGPLSDLLKGFDLNEFEQGVSKPALQHFTDRILPQLQEKFIAGGQAGSPGAAREIGRAGQDLQGVLAGLLYQAQQSHKQGKNQNLLDLLKIHQQPSSENVHTPGHSGLAPAIFKAGADITGNLAAEGYKNYNNPPATTSVPTTTTPAVVG